MPRRTRHYEIQPRFLPTGGGALCSVCFRPAKETGKALVFCPPFAEEMNKCRRMMVLTAQQLAAGGVTSVIVDLIGTGDSSGQFSDASWGAWRENIATTLGWLTQNRDYEVSLCGVRLGAALALDVARSGDAAVTSMVFWQPVISGSTFMTQFLRLKLAAQLHDGGGITTDALRAQSAAGSSVEVAGYELTPELIAAVDAIDLKDERYRPSIPVRWLEVVSESRPKPGIASQRVMTAWREHDVVVDEAVVIGDPFWATTEITVVPGLIDATVSS